VEKKDSAGGEGREGGACGFMTSGAMACPCCRRQGLDLWPSGPDICYRSMESRGLDIGSKSRFLKNVSLESCV
jgi:hypothetical protein